MIGVVVGFAAVGMRAGPFMVGVLLLPARTAWDAAWPRLQARGEAAFDDALAGPLTDQALQAGLAEQIADRLLAPDVLDSPLLLEITDRVMASDEMQRVIAHIASSPELRAAITEQTSGLTEEMVAGVRQRTVSMDDVAERTVRGWLRRPRPMTT
jgi:hypothetical protein